MSLPTGHEIERLLAHHCGVHPIPEASADAAARLRKTPAGRNALAWARAESDVPIPHTTYTSFREFRRTGTRHNFQDVYFKKRELLARAALACWLDEDSAVVDRICDFIWNICEESTWVLPAHEGPAWNVDLFAAETASDLAHCVFLLKERLPREIVHRVNDEVERRVFRNYLGSAGFFGYDRQSIQNWTGVCFGSMGEAALLLDARPGLQSDVVAVAAARIADYFEQAFLGDGASTEGVMYWNYGLMHAITFSEMLRVRTGGAIDLLDHPRLRLIARYPLAMWLGDGTYANLADADSDAKLCAFITSRIATRTGTPELAQLGVHDPGFRFGVALYNLIWAHDAQPGNPGAGHFVFPQAGVVRCAADAAGQPLYLIAKAGHNGEHHNHNDVGSFILHIGGAAYLCDPGRGLYSRDYFVPETRYKNPFVTSYGHSVPVVGGTLQGFGSQFAGTLTAASPDGFTIDMAHAYPCPNLRTLTRTMALHEDGGILEDTFEFDGAPQAIQEAFMTWLPVEIAGRTARITSGNGSLTIEAGDGVFRAESMEETCKANHREGVLTRITADYPPRLRQVARFEMRYVPR